VGGGPSLLLIDFQWETGWMAIKMLVEIMDMAVRMEIYYLQLFYNIFITLF
jgi:hypothetical protein